ncbi:hypothetical protein [Pseudomonas sp. RT6P73]
MNDLTLNFQNKKADLQLPGRQRPRFAPVISSVRTSSGVTVQNGGGTTETSLSLVGVGPINTKVQIFDGSVLLQAVNADGTGHWSALLQDLQVGTHAFSAVSVDNQHSPLWIVHVEAAIRPEIGHVTDSKHQMIEDGGITTDRSLRLYGKADPKNKIVELFDLGCMKAYAVLNENGDWEVQLDDVEYGHHAYQMVTPDGQVSGIWTVIVNATVIESVSDSKGNIPHFGSTTETSLSFVGSAKGDQKLSLYDSGELKATVNVVNNHWSARLDGLSVGPHEFEAISEDESRSKSRVIFVIAETPSIVSVKDSAGKPLGNGDSTSESSVTLDGHAAPNEEGRLVDYNGTLQHFVTNQYGHWSVQVEGLAVAVHTFRVVMTGGLTSTPWIVRVIEPTKK